MYILSNFAKSSKKAFNFFSIYDKMKQNKMCKNTPKEDKYGFYEKNNG